MPLRKVFAVAVAAGVLGAQLWAILPPGNTGKSWYWPLMDYPMYSTPHYAGEAFRTYELRGASCTPERTPTPLSARLLGITTFRFFGIVEAIGKATEEPSRNAAAADSAVALLDRLVHTRLSEPVCEVQLWRKAVVLERGGVKDFDPSWALVCGWSTATGETRPRRRAGLRACTS